MNDTERAETGGMSERIGRRGGRGARPDGRDRHLRACRMAAA
ncbi:hypothetical protein [Micromonospora sp. SL4-19]